MNTSFRHYFLLFAVFAAALAAGFAAQAQFAPSYTLAPSNADAFAKSFLSYEPYDPPVLAPALTFYKLDGGSVRLDEYRGKWRLLNFWATWCAPCIVEMPTLMALKENYKDRNFDVLFISLDHAATPEELAERLGKLALPAGFETFYVTDAGPWDLLGVDSLPTSYILGPDGRIHYKLVGDTDWMMKESLEFIAELMNNQPSGLSP